MNDVYSGWSAPLKDSVFSRVIQVDKVGGLDFLACAEKIWSEKKILLIGDASTLGLSAAEHWAVKSQSGWWEGKFAPDNTEELAQISSTSGTTGTPKGVAISRRAISDTIHRLASAMEINSSIREYVGVPVTFSFGLGRARAVSAVGGASFIPENGFRPDEIGRMLAGGEINALSAVPSMLRALILSPELIGSEGRKLRWLEIGSQFMSAQEKRAVRDLFPEAIILQHYGLTEASRTTFLRIDGASDLELESVGRPGGAAQLRIGQDGRIEISGAHLASGIVDNGRLVPLTDEDGWFTTNDLGELRSGWLHYLGRMDDVANIGGVKVSAEYFERQLADRIAKPASFAVCIISDSLRGEKLAVGWDSGGGGELRTAALAVASELGMRQADLVLTQVSKLPLTATGKVKRGDLARDIQRTQSRPEINDATSTPSPALSASQARVAKIWSEALGVSTVGPDDCFYDLGGDSLSAITVLLKAEQVGLSQQVMQRMFAGETVAQIARVLDDSAADHVRNEPSAVQVRAVRADALSAVRGLLAVSIVVSHWGPFFVKRLGAAGADVWSLLAPLLKIGTPGFAMVYGMGLGFFYFQQIENPNLKLRRRITRNTVLLVSGVILIAAAETWRISATGAEFGINWPERLFYGVILFYALMVPTSLFWLRCVSLAKDRVFGALLLATGAYAVHALVSAIWPVNPFTGWASLGWHMLVAPYAYPRLLGASGLGLAAALWLTSRSDAADLQAAAGKSGLILGLVGLILVAELEGGWSEHAGSLFAIIAFAGLTLLLYAGAVWLARRRRAAASMRLAITCGMIAFPIFIGHGLVIPTKAALEAYGLAGPAAQGLTVSIFLAAMVWLGLRVDRLMFGGRGSRN